MFLEHLPHSHFRTFAPVHSNVLSLHVLQALSFTSFRSNVIPSRYLFKGPLPNKIFLTRKLHYLVPNSLPPTSLLSHSL